MTSADFFTLFGIYIAKDFFNAEQCKKFREEVCSASLEKATVADGHTSVLDETIRRTQSGNVSTQTESFVKARLLELKPALERHFDLELKGCERLQFLIYRNGDFYIPHLDRGTALDSPEYSKDRRVSVVIFLNGEDQKPHPDTYGGGTLVFYGLMDDQRLKTSGFSLNGEEGLLIAFRSDVLHEVTPVTLGERYTVVSWFF